MSNFKIAIGNWKEYWADGSLDLPSDPRQLNVWGATTAGTGTASVAATTSGEVPSGYILDIETGGADKYMFEHIAGTAPFVEKANNSQGYTIEAKLCVVASSNEGQRIEWNDDVYQEQLLLRATNIELGQDGTTYTMDTTADYYRYRLTIKDTEVKVFVDDILRITGALATAAGTLYAPKLAFGDNTTTSSGHVNWAYMRYSTVDAFSSDENWYISNIDLQDRRKSSISNIIRSHNSIIKEAKMSPTRIKLTGTIAGTCYDSYRDTVRRLKKLLLDGHQRVYLDDERYIVGLHNGFPLKPATSDYAKFNINFDCRYPFYQNLWADYFSTVPVANATFYVINEGDVEVPVKIIITGVAAATITNDVRLKNITAEQDAKYTGTLFATQEVIIDKGFDDYNTYKVLAGSNAHASYNSSFGSYEGDLFTLKPGQNNFVFIGTPAGTLEFYFRKAFLQ